MIHCSVCLELRPLVRASCKCVYCHDCLLAWLEEKIQVDINAKSIPCLNTECTNKFQLDEIRDCLESPDQEIRFQEITFNQYLKKSADIRPCPNSQCKGYAYLPQYRCGEEFKCQYCDFVWLDKNYLSLSTLIPLKCKQLKSETLSSLIEFVFTQPCPNCACPILKNGGCSHMTCKKCNYYYCWICKNQVNSHSENACNLKLAVYFMLFLQCLLSFLGMLDVLGYFLYILKPFVWFFLLVYLNLVIILPIQTVVSLIYLVGSIIKYIKQQTRSLKMDIFKSIGMLVVNIMLYFGAYYLIEPLKLEYEDFIYFHTCQLYTVLTGIVIGGITFCFNTYIYKDWLKHLI